MISNSSIRIYLEAELQATYGRSDPTLPTTVVQKLLQMHDWLAGEARPDRLITPDDIGKVYSSYSAHFDAVMAVARADFISETRDLAQLIEVSGAKRVLDAGCGTAIITAFLCKQFRAVEFVGYDVSAKMIDRAQDRAHRLKLKNASFLVLDHLSARRNLRGEFDLIVAIGSVGTESRLTCQNLTDIDQDLAKGDRHVIQWSEEMRNFSELLEVGGRYLRYHRTEDHTRNFLKAIGERHGFVEESFIVPHRQLFRKAAS